MNNNNMLLTAGQFASLHNINKRTLHYYDDIGLFSPACKGENGYRYYTYLQSTTLEMLLTLRELGMSIEDIQNYMSNRSSEALISLIRDKTSEIDTTIKRLKKMQKLLAEKEQQLLLPQNTDMNTIQLVECREEYLLLSSPISGTYNDSDMAILTRYAQEQREHRMFNYSYGSMFELKKAIALGVINERFFIRVDKPNKKDDLFIKPQGRYVRAFCLGNWDNLPKTYLRILDFAKGKGFTLAGYAYEEGINEMAISSMDEYITQVMILCE